MLSARDDGYAVVPDLGTMPYAPMPILSSQNDDNTSATPYAAMPVSSSTSTTDYAASVSSYGTEFSPIINNKT
jgi:hypothetical protein